MSFSSSSSVAGSSAWPKTSHLKLLLELQSEAQTDERTSSTFHPRGADTDDNSRRKSKKKGYSHLLVLLFAVFPAMLTINFCLVCCSASFVLSSKGMVLRPVC